MQNAKHTAASAPKSGLNVFQLKPLLRPPASLVFSKDGRVPPVREHARREEQSLCNTAVRCALVCGGVPGLASPTLVARSQIPFLILLLPSAGRGLPVIYTAVRQSPKFFFVPDGARERMEVLFFFFFFLLDTRNCYFQKVQSGDGS